MPTIAGHIRSIRHNTDDFYIASMEVEEAQPRIMTKMVAVKGAVVGLTQMRVDTAIRLTGEWKTDPKWGHQFIIHGWAPWWNGGADAKRFLRECIPGFLEEQFVSRLVDHFQERVFDVLSKDPEAVFALFEEHPRDDFYGKMIESALLSWGNVKATYELASFLGDHDIGSQHIKSVIEVFGHEALKIVSHNPYRLLSVMGWGFVKVDAVAERLGITQGDGRRYEGAVFWCLREAAHDGHLFVRRGDLPSMAYDLVHRNNVSPFEGDLAKGLAAAVERLEKEGVVKVDPSAGVYLLDNWKYERESATKLAEFVTKAKIDIDVKQFLSDYEKGQSIELSPAQRECIEVLVENRVLALTGLPGTGKTTVVRAIVSLFEAAGVTYRLMAPTGIAAKRMSGVTGREGSTIHRLFKYDGVQWGHNRYSPYPVGAIIVDEMSMVDMELLYRILDCMTPETMLVFVGDDAQLPSVGPGNVLRELVRSGVPHVRLTQIFRQKKTSDIVTNSHKINRGETLSFAGVPPESEFQFVPVADEERAVDLIVKMALKLKSKDANFQVLSPKYEGTVGVNNLNTRLREALNPSRGQPEAKFGQSLHVREGDRLMIIRNNYQLGVYNGDMGKLRNVAEHGVTLQVHGETDALVSLAKKDCSPMLRLAYAITVHKSQGSEFDTVIIPVYRSQGRMLLRNLLYTAVTRAKKKVWLIGDLGAIQRAVDNDNIVQRNTAFGKAVSEAIAAKKLAGVANESDRREPAGSSDGRTEGPSTQPAG